MPARSTDAIGVRVVKFAKPNLTTMAVTSGEVDTAERQALRPERESWDHGDSPTPADRPRSDALPTKVRFHDPTGEPLSLAEADENAPWLVAAGRWCVRGGASAAATVGDWWQSRSRRC